VEIVPDGETPHTSRSSRGPPAKGDFFISFSRISELKMLNSPYKFTTEKAGNCLDVQDVLATPSTSSSGNVQGPAVDDSQKGEEDEHHFGTIISFDFVLCGES
jgi:hypothetical protein